MTPALTETLDSLLLYLQRNRGRVGDSRILEMARDPRLPLDVVIELIESSDPFVRAEIAYRPGLPVWVVQRLCADEEGMVSEVARERARELGLTPPV